MATKDDEVTKNASDPMEAHRREQAAKNQQAANTGPVKNVEDRDPQREGARAADNPDDLADGNKKLGEKSTAAKAGERQALPATGNAEAEPRKGLAEPANPPGHPIEDRQAHDSVAGKPHGVERMKIKGGGQKVPDKFDVIVDNVIVGRSEDLDERTAIEKRERTK